MEKEDRMEAELEASIEEKIRIRKREKAKRRADTNRRMEKVQPSRKKRRVEPGSEAGGEDDALDQPRKAHQQENKEEKPQKRKDMPEEKRPTKKARKNGDMKRYISCKKWKEEVEKARMERDV